MAELVVDKRFEGVTVVAHEQCKEVVDRMVAEAEDSIRTRLNGMLLGEIVVDSRGCVIPQINAQREL